MQKRLSKNRHLKRQHEPHHPFDDEQIALQRRHVVVALAQRGRELQSLVVETIDGAERLEDL
jgi:hypothetical protein